ncbi:trigger factor [Lishizhenia tianjinensis]|uniref:Trigger factor n=1 Tax=Lishizhenia tianjinensis TaxID=477690 RepID=A0A1I7A3K4_9FLAO|nr:trigger factor [Lishizhenia tianjinensis]SFT69467.1 trigger factor [Lishizhenia tianjinensis]
MNVTRENVDELNAILKVEVAKEDYEKKVNDVLSNYRKQANIPGFRKGKVPMGMIKKQYGAAVLGDELNKIVNDALYNYIQENELDILGNPIPKNDAEVKGDFNNPADFEFTYEIGLAPEFDIKLSGRNKYDYVKVKADDKVVDQEVDNMRRRYGKLSAGETVTENDLVMGQFVELVKKDVIKEGGVMNSSTISMEFVEDETTRKKLLGAKVGDAIMVNPEKVSRGGKDTAAMLGVKEEELADLSKKFQFTIHEIKQMELAELNQELFDKLFGEGEIKSEEELRARIAADLERVWSNDSDRLLARNITKDLLAKTEFELPNTFLKRWIQMSQPQDKPVSMEEIEAQYEGYQENLKWQLIQGKIFKSNDIKIDQAEALEYTKGLMAQQYAQYGMPAPEDKELTEVSQKVLANQEEAQRVYDMLADQKLTTFFKETVKLTEKEVSFDEFVKLAEEAQA